MELKEAATDSCTRGFPAARSGWSLDAAGDETSMMRKCERSEIEIASVRR